MIDRDISPRLKQLATQFPAIVLTGPRQSGKSTLCRSTFVGLPYTTLESPDVKAFAVEDPRGFLARYPDGAILDEIQNCPNLTSYLQELIDKDPIPGRWILTGSHNLSVLQSTSQSLAGRTAILHLLPLAYGEVVQFATHPMTLDETLFAGGYPRILDQQLHPSDWLSSYVATYLERDVRTLSQIGDLVTFQRFVQLCAGRTAQLLNLSSLASDCGISQPTAKAWLSVLEASFIAFRLPSYHGNVSKRLIKMPKLHFYDSGLRLEGGPCELHSVSVHPRGGEYYGARLAFSNGQNVSVPLYIPTLGGDAGQELKAEQIANEVGHVAARKGEVDLVEWALAGRIPLRAYLQDRLRNARQAGHFPKGLRFTSQMMPILRDRARRTPDDEMLLRRYCVSLFNGDTPTKEDAVYVSVPPEFAATDTIAFLDNAVEAVFGAESRRHQLKSSHQSPSTNQDAVVIDAAPAWHLKHRPGLDTIMVFRAHAAMPQFSCSLGTKDADLVENRSLLLNAFIEQTLADGQSLTIADVKHRAAELARELSPEKVPARVNSSRAGPVIVHAPLSVDEKGKPKEALRLYTALSGKPESGFELRVNVVGPNRRGTDGIYAVTCAISPDRRFMLPQMETLRGELRDFLHERLSAYYLAGGQFRDQSDIAFDSKGKSALTVAGAEKFRRILEGRLNSKFVDACLSEGIGNPFDLNLSPAAVQRLGGFSSMPQPAYPEMRLLHPRTVQGDASSGHIRTTLVWTKPNGTELFRRDLGFRDITQLNGFVKEIDGWTTASVAAGEPELPTHAGIELLRRICADHSHNRQQEGPP